MTCKMIVIGRQWLLSIYEHGGVNCRAKEEAAASVAEKGLNKTPSARSVPVTL